MPDLRWMFILTLVGAYGLYLPLNRRQSKYYWKWPIDNHIPLIPISVWVYLTYFILVPLSILLTWPNSQISTQLLVSLLFAKAVSLPFWFIWPNGVKRPLLVPNSISKKILACIYRNDGDTNGCPSSHVFTSLIATQYLSLMIPSWSIFFWIWGSAICVSTVTTKQHYLGDVLWGGVLAGLSIYISTHFA
jgi:membrane-associated phospholipid phosphatase